MARPDMQFLESGAPGSYQWFSAIEGINDVFNYSIGFACAHALAAKIPNAAVLRFPWPNDLPTDVPDEAQQYGCVWLREENEQDLSPSSRVLSFSGACSAKEWADGEFLGLESAVVCEMRAPSSAQEESLHRMIVQFARSLPWMPSIDDAVPALPSSSSSALRVVQKFTKALGKMNGSPRAHASAWPLIESSEPCFAPLWSDKDARALQQSTQPVQSNRSTRRI